MLLFMVRTNINLEVACLGLEVLHSVMSDRLFLDDDKWVFRM